MTKPEHDLFYQKHADFCTVFSNANRLKILDLLKGGDAFTVSELESAAEDLSQPTISQHLKLMRDQNIVAREKDGVHSYYSITDDRIVEGMELIREVLRDQGQV